MTRFLFTGGRDYDDFEMVDEIVHLIAETFVGPSIIEGGARGLDTLARGAAIREAVQVFTFPADWERHGRAAGPMRNTQMLEDGKPDYCIWFNGGRGTRDMRDKAIRAGVQTYYYKDAVTWLNALADGVFV